MVNIALEAGNDLDVARPSDQSCDLAMIEFLRPRSGGDTSDDLLSERLHLHVERLKDRRGHYGLRATEVQKRLLKPSAQNQWRLRDFDGDMREKGTHHILTALVRRSPIIAVIAATAYGLSLDAENLHGVRVDEPAPEAAAQLRSAFSRAVPNANRFGYVKPAKSPGSALVIGSDLVSIVKADPPRERPPRHLY